MTKAKVINPNKKFLRKDIPYCDGVNSLVGRNLAKLNEFAHLENARSDTIGTLEKRAGTVRIGNDVTATANLGLFFFDNDSTNQGLYRVSTLAGVTNIYNLNVSSVWAALTGSGADLLRLGDATTTYSITCPVAGTYRYTYTSVGTDPLISSKIAVGSSVVINAQNFAAGNKGTFTVTAVASNYFEVVNASGVIESDKTIGTGSITIASGLFSTAIAEKRLFLVNGSIINREISKSDGATVTLGTNSASNLYLAPMAHKVNYYKDRIYLADYIDAGGTRHETGVMMSSTPLGIAALTTADYEIGVTSIKVSSTKYIHSTDSLDVYRGDTFIQTLTVSGKTEDTITVTATTTALQASDELWVAGTHTGERKFRWAGVPASGENVKSYDTFNISGGQNGPVKMMTNIGDYMVIAGADNFSLWNDSALKNMDNGIGCVSDKGYAKAFDTLFFLGYKGIFSTSGGTPELISAKVQKYIEGATKAGLEAAAMGVKGYSIFCAIGDVTLYNDDGSSRKTLSDVVLEKNLKTQNWYVHTGIPATMFATFIESTKPDTLAIASTDTKYPIMEFLSGSLDNSATEIPFAAETGDITLAEEFEFYCNVHQIVIEVERGAGMSCWVSLDKGAFYEVPGRVTKGCNIITVTGEDEDALTPPKCRQINVSIRDNSKQICKVSRLAIIYTLTAEQDSPEEN